jgi:hypothetical protein
MIGTLSQPDFRLEVYLRGRSDPEPALAAVVAKSPAVH